VFGRIQILIGKLLKMNFVGELDFTFYAILTLYETQFVFRRDCDVITLVQKVREFSLATP
jgi:hypothetical protein